MRPPVTDSAWMMAMTGKDPGKLRIYGFRRRKPGARSDGCKSELGPRGRRGCHPVTVKAP